MVNRHLQVWIYVDQPWSMLINFDHMIKYKEAEVELGTNARACAHKRVH